MHAGVVRIAVGRGAARGLPAPGTVGRWNRARMYWFSVRAPRDYFSPVSARRGHRGKIVPRSAARILGTWQPTVARPPRAPMAIPRAAVSPCRVLHTIDWEGEQALSGLTLFDARTRIACASTTGSWSICNHWAILIVSAGTTLLLCSAVVTFHTYRDFSKQRPEDIAGSNFAAERRRVLA